MNKQQHQQQYQRIAVAQMSPRVGFIDDNVTAILALAELAHEQHADLIVYPELATTGYLPDDLLFHDDFIARTLDAVQHITEQSARWNIALLLSTPYQENGKLYNSLLWIEGGKIRAVYHKQILPNHSVFDEKRYFTPGSDAVMVEFGQHKIGLLVCEDSWHDAPARAAVAQGATLLIVSNASPWYVGKEADRLAAISKIAANNQTPVLYVHGVGTQDEVVFDGASFALNANAQLTFCAPQFKKGLHLLTLSEQGFEGDITPNVYQYPNHDEQLWQALVIATREFVKRMGFDRVVLGLSGGIDSALVLAIAVEALGENAVTALLMPSNFTAQMSVDDALILAHRLNVKTHTVPIAPLMTTFDQTLAPLFVDQKRDVTEENLQARIRGSLLMAYSNKHKALLLTTGNKSELATGYCTLYGDMCGAFAVIKDLYKTQVFALARWYNQRYPEHAIPERIMNRAPSAELRENQTDQDSLPEYDVLDAMLFRLVEQRESAEDLVREGFDEALVKRVVQLLKQSEFKRKQGVLGPKISRCSFGKDWRYPLMSGF